MRRRNFLEAAATALAAAGQVGGQDRPAGTSRHTLKLGTQNDSSEQALGVLAAFGVNHVCSTLPSARMDANWSVEGLTRLRERVESFGIRLEMVPLPLSSNYIARSENPNIMLGKSPERDREIDTICQMIRNAARAGIPALKYNLTILGVVRSAPSRGRGGRATARSTTRRRRKSRR
jgi:mannonate dehydratase